MDKQKCLLCITRRRVRLPIAALAWNLIAFNGANLITRGWERRDLTLSLDSAVPFMPWTIIIYFGAFAFWAVNYIISANQDREKAYRFFCADFIAKIIAFIFFLSFPCTLVRPEIEGGGVWNSVMRFLYWVDPPSNLFPSLHCFMSWLCWIGVRSRKDVPAWYRWFSLAIALAICVSTLTTRQHVFLDTVSGVALAEICYAVSGTGAVKRIYSKAADKLIGGAWE